MNETIDKFVNDMRKILEFEKSYGKMEYTQQMSSSKYGQQGTHRQWAPTSIL